MFRNLFFVVVLASSPALISCGEDAREIQETCADESTCAVFELVNQERASAGAPALAHSGELQLAAQLHAEDMQQNGYFSHDSQDGRNFVVRAREAGYGGMPSAENIANGQRSAEQVMSSWMNSSGHRANILGGHDEIGIGRAGNYWVQVFGRR